MSLSVTPPAVRFDCPQCGRALSVDRRFAGKRAICPECEKLVDVPAAEEAEEPIEATSVGARLPAQSAARLTEAWYCSINGRQYGPMSTPALLAEMRAGRLSPLLAVWRSGMNDWALATQVPELRDAGVPPAPLPEPARTPSQPQELPRSPVWLIVALHYLTFGMFSLVWFNLMHGRMPRVRGDDPSAARAIGFLLIPVFNLYWLFFTHRRLCERLNDARIQHGLAPNIPDELSTVMCICLVVPCLAPIGWLILAPVFYGLTQASVNELVDQP